MNKNDWVVVAPFPQWSVMELAVHGLVLLILVKLAGQLLQEIKHKDEHDNISILLQGIASQVVVPLCEKTLWYNTSVFNEPKEVYNSLYCPF